MTSKNNNAPVERSEILRQIDKIRQNVSELHRYAQFAATARENQAIDRINYINQELGALAQDLEAVHPPEPQQQKTITLNVLEFSEKKKQAVRQK